LDDTIEEFDPAMGVGTGFKFAAYSGAALLGAVSRALAAFSDRVQWIQLMKNGMGKDFSWQRSAREYRKLYLELAGKHAPARKGYDGLLHRIGT
jgi:starch synthase